MANEKASRQGQGASTRSECQRSHPTRLLLGWGFAIGLYIAALVIGARSERIAGIINDVAWTFAAALATLSSYRAARISSARDRLVWSFFCAAALSWTVAQVVWDFYELVLGISVPFPSYADIGYFAFGPLILIGLLVLRKTQSERRLSWLRVANLSLILCSLAIAVFITLTQPFLRPQLPPGSTLIVVGENATIAMAFMLALYLLWSYRWDRWLVAVTLITLSLGMQTIAGLLYTRGLVNASYGAASFFNFAWVLAFALHQSAAQLYVHGWRSSPSSTAVRDSHVWVELLIPSFLVLCIAAAAFFLAREITDQVIRGAAMVLGVFAVILGVREAWLYSRGERLRGMLQTYAEALRALQERLDSTEKLRKELEQVVGLAATAGGVGLWQWRLQTNAVRFSVEYKRQLGFEDHELRDHFDEWKNRLHPDDEAHVTRALAQFVDCPVGVYVSEHRLQHRDGSYRWMLVRGTMVTDDAGKLTRMLGSQVDITPFKELERSLRASEARYRDLAADLESRVTHRTQELLEAYRESQSFAYAVAHDLKAPLRAMDGFSALLLASATTRLNEEERAFVDRVRHGAIQMAALIDGLLSYSRVEHREQRIAALDCQECVEEVLGSLAELIRAADATVEVEIGHAQVMADGEGLKLVFRNLLENALKFSRPGTRPHIRIGAISVENSCVLSVQDNGIGFDPLYKERIFMIFHRLHASGFEGTGIGLALVRKAVQRMGGKVWVESRPNLGSTFFVSLARASVDHSTSAATKA